MGTYCGSNLPPRLTSLSNKMIVQFNSDHHDHKSGFSASWRRVDTSTEEYGYITTPGYPNKYPSCHTERLKVISGPKGSTINMQILDLDLPNYAGAYVVITEGTPGPIYDQPYCLDYDYYDYYDYRSDSGRVKSKKEKRKLFREDEQDQEENRYIYGADEIATIRGNRPTSKWRIQSKTNTVSIYFVEYGYRGRRKGLKMAWFLEKPTNDF